MKKTLSLLILAAAACSAQKPAGEISSVAEALTIDTNATYTISGSPSGKCVGIVGASVANSASAELRTCNATTAQKFRIQVSTTGYYKITNVNSGKCLDVTGASTAANAKVIQYTCNGATNQQWAIADTTAGAVKLTARHSSKVLAPTNGAATDGTLMVQQTWSSATYQSFVLSTGAGGTGGVSGTGGAGGSPGTGGAGGSSGAGGASLPILPSKSSIISALTLVNSAFMAKWPDPGVAIVTDKSRPSNIWTRAVYFEGLMGLHAVDPHPSYYNYAILWGTDHSWNMAYDSATTRVADNQACAQTYLDLYKIDPQPVRIQNTTTSLLAMVNSAVVNDWSWIDALQMAMPAFVKLGGITGNQAYFDKMYAMYAYSKNTFGFYNQTEHLWWRDATFKPPYTAPNGQDSYWSRGNGWVYAALVRVLEALPATDAHRAEYLLDFQNMSSAILAVQRSDGFWNVSLHDPNDFGGPETTGTSLFAYGMAFGVRNGFLATATYLPAISKAWSAMASAVHTNGFLGYVQGTGKQPSDGQPVTYDSVPNFEDFGVGCFLLGGSEISKLAQ